MDTCTLCLCTPICKGSVPTEEDFVNVNAIQRWQQAVSAGKWALRWAERNDSQENRSGIWNGVHFVVTCWGRVTGGRASESPSRGGGGEGGGCTFPLQHFYLCQILDLSEPEWEVRLYFSCYARVLSIWHLSAEDSGPQDKAACCTISEGWWRCKSRAPTTGNHSHSQRPEESLETFFFVFL